MSDDTIAAAVSNSLEAIPPLPLIVTYVLELASNDDVSTLALAHALEADPGLTAKILKISNSAFYAPVERVYTVRDAIRLVGFETVRSLAITSTIVHSIWVDDVSFSRQMFWRHSLRCGLFSRAIGSMIRNLPCDILFTIGVLHDIGKIALINFDPERYKLVLSESQKERSESWILERKFFGVDHSEVGASLAEKWALPPLYRSTIAGHHLPAMAGPDRKFASILRLADALAHSASPKDGHGIVTPPLVPLLWQDLNLSDSSVKAIYDARDVIEEHTKSLFETATIG
jgi:putative nucleotidyltransferase with HDIG domain